MFVHRLFVKLLFGIRGQKCIILVEASSLEYKLFGQVVGKVHARKIHFSDNDKVSFLEFLTFMGEFFWYVVDIKTEMELPQKIFDEQ